MAACIKLAYSVYSFKVNFLFKFFFQPALVNLVLLSFVTTCCKCSNTKLLSAGRVIYYEFVTRHF